MAAIRPAGPPPIMRASSIESTFEKTTRAVAPKLKTRPGAGRGFQTLADRRGIVPAIHCPTLQQGGRLMNPEQTARAVATPTRPGDPDRFFPGHTPRSTDSVHTRHRPHVLSSCTARRRRSRNWCRRHYCRSIGRTMDGRSQQSWETQRERRPVRKMRATNDKPSVSFKFSLIRFLNSTSLELSRSG